MLPGQIKNWRLFAPGRQNKLVFIEAAFVIIHRHLQLPPAFTGIDKYRQHL
jgi:hypothetical protein